MRSTEWVIKNKMRQFTGDLLLISMNPPFLNSLPRRTRETQPDGTQDFLSKGMSAMIELPWDLRLRIPSP